MITYLLIGCLTSSFVLWVYLPLIKEKFKVRSWKSAYFSFTNETGDIGSAVVYAIILGLCSIYMWPAIHFAMFAYVMYDVTNTNPFKKKEVKDGDDTDTQ